MPIVSLHEPVVRPISLNSVTVRPKAVIYQRSVGCKPNHLTFCTRYAGSLSIKRSQIYTSKLTNR